MSNLYKDICTSGLDANKPTAALDIANQLPNTFQFYYATDTGILYRWTGSAWSANTQATPQAVGAAKTASKSSGLIYALDTASGSVLTLPGATGSGLALSAYVKTTASSNAHKILTSPITDVIIGQAWGSAAAGVTKAFFGAVASGFHSVQMPFAGTQPSGGFEGDIFNFRDVASGVWLLEAHYQAGTTATTPFSTATT